jgi:hypothetical protein
MRRLFVLLFLAVVLVGGASSFGSGTLHACSDIRCETRSACTNCCGGSYHYQSTVCLTSCGYWYEKSRCCGVTYPTPC